MGPINELRQWVERNPVTETGKKKTIQIDNTRQQNATNRKCGFCDVTGHKRNDCTEVKDPVKHKKIMSSKNLFFNCLKYGHRAAD